MRQTTGGRRMFEVSAAEVLEPRAQSPEPAEKRDVPSRCPVDRCPVDRCTIDRCTINR
jgi:hypothetical protein